jgi:hypothetical protein
VAGWHEVRPVLTRLEKEQPGALVLYPRLNATEQSMPVRITFAAWAVDVAAELHRQFGGDLNLTVGALPYPPGGAPKREFVADEDMQAPLLDPLKVTAELDGPAVVRSGHRLRHGLLVGNLTSEALRISTNGMIWAVVVDRQTGEVVGGYSGAYTLMLMMFDVAPGQTERIPLLIATESFTPRLGYAIPPGDWGVQARLRASSDSGRSTGGRTPILPLTVT